MLTTTTATAVSVGIATLRANPLRTILSTLGVVIGVASLVAVLAVGDGMEQYGLQSIEGEGIQSIVVEPVQGERVDGVWIARPAAVRLTSADAADLEAALPAGTDLSMRAMGAGLVSAGEGRQRGARLSGVLPPAKGHKQLAVVHGRMLTRDEGRTGARVAVLSPDLGDSLAAGRGAASLVGTPIRFSTGAEFTVVGIVSMGEMARPNMALVPVDALPLAMPAPVGALAAASMMLPSPSITVTAPAVGEVPAVKKAIESWAARRHGDKAKELRIAQLASEERVEQMRRGVLAFKLFMGAIVGISLVVGGIGIMNVLLASVTERTREIGIRKTTGARGRDILEQFLAESVVITGAGAAIGVVLGLTGAFGLTAVIRAFAKVPVHAAVTGWTLLIAIGVSVVTGLVFGTYPARRAARLSPIEAIRHE